MTVLGTSIASATDDARPRTILLSDLHLGSRADHVFDALERVLTAAREHAADTRVLILGDLFDVWVNAGQMRIPPWNRVVAMLRSTTDAGVACTLLHGNRDFMLDDRFAAASGCRVVPGGIRLRLDGRPVLALHGDELCQRDVDYQRAKRYLRHPLTRTALGCLPTRFALALGDRARRKSRSVVARQPDRERFEPTRAAVEAAFGTGAELLVFGHIHREARGSFVTPDGRECEYCVLPAFDVAGVHLRYEQGALRFCDALGEGVPDPAPRSFA